MSGEQDMSTPSGLIEEVRRVLKLIRRRTKTHKPVLRHYFVRPLLIDGDVESNPGPVATEELKPRTRRGGLHTKYRVLLTTIFLALISFMTSTPTSAESDRTAGNRYFYLSGGTLPEPDEPDQQSLDALAERNTSLP